MKTNLVEIKRGNVGTGLLLESDGYASLDMPENKTLKESIDNFKNGDANELPRPFVVSAVFQKYGVENANGRIYPEMILKREVEKYQEAIKERRAYGELNHPDSSAIDGERICMNIVELHWVGKTLVGKIELPITEGFRRYGICSNLADTVAQWLITDLKIGVSSRALGSVTQQMGHLIVGDDLELVCWDVVTQPSTPGAWMDSNEEELKPYVESTEKKDNIIKEDKFSKFDKWLLNN